MSNVGSLYPTYKSKVRTGIIVFAVGFVLLVYVRRFFHQLAVDIGNSVLTTGLSATLFFASWGLILGYIAWNYRNNLKYYRLATEEKISFGRNVALAIPVVGNAMVSIKLDK
ncbi:MAG TPA: hypothetical protein VND94_09770 [Terriglobia bacterium]|nr:hypothetical protein [Terriglobia bacterium]